MVLSLALARHVFARPPGGSAGEALGAGAVAGAAAPGAAGSSGGADRGEGAAGEFVNPGFSRTPG